MINPKTVAVQLSRIRKKAEKIDFTYKIESGAEHVQKYKNLPSPASELKKKILEDPGFFAAMFRNYTGDNCNQQPLESSDTKLLLKARGKHLKLLSISGKKAK